MPENADHCVSAWRDSEGNIPEPETVVTLADVEEGRFTIVDETRAPVVLKYLKSLYDRYSAMAREHRGMHLMEDPPICDTCGVMCHWGCTQFWRAQKPAYDPTGTYPREEEPKAEYVVTRSLCTECHLGEQKETYCGSKILVTNLVTHCACEAYRVGPLDRVTTEINIVAEKVYALVRQFEAKIWKGGLGKYYLARDRGMEAKLPSGTTLMMYSLAGRVMCQLGEEDGTYLSMITTDEPIDDRPRMGLRGICATFEEAEAMFQEAFTAWDNEELFPVANHNIRLFGT